MRIVSISDCEEYYIGLRLAGIEVIEVDSQESFKSAFDRIINDPDIAIIIVTKRYVYDRVNQSIPLIMEL